jgi:hypothetical protein
MLPAQQYRPHKTKPVPQQQGADHSIISNSEALPSQEAIRLFLRFMLHVSQHFHLPSISWFPNVFLYVEGLLKEMTFSCKICGSHGGNYEECRLL